MQFRLASSVLRHQPHGGIQFHMAHELASAVQQAFRIGKLGTTKKPDVDVGFEDIDIGEGRIADTGGRMAHQAMTLERRLRSRPAT